jgi:hypothetical protein
MVKLLPTRQLSGLLALALGTVACGGDTLSPCSVPADCASGVCLPDGTCAAPTPDAEVDTNSVLFPDAPDIIASDSAEPDTLADISRDATPDTGPSPACLPDGDGLITRAEIPIAPELRATWLIAKNASFETAGTPNTTPRWDLSTAFPGDARVLLETRAPSSFWFAEVFPTASYASLLEVGGDLFGAFEARNDGLYLLGVASETDGLTRTELVYDPPAKLMSFPLELDASWTTTSTITGLTNGVPSLVTETWTGKVDARGEVSTPFADFDALRINLRLDRLVGAVPYFEVQHLFVSECFGTVASLRSEGYVAGPEFSDAAELRRLAP